jgi:hypothetical protein
MSGILNREGAEARSIQSQKLSSRTDVRDLFCRLFGQIPPLAPLRRNDNKVGG